MSHVRVLVVDDDSAVRRSLSTALGRDGYEVLAAEGGNAALDHLVAASVDAIVLDVAMPEPNGLEVCRRLRARGDRTPILMLTARDLVDSPGDRRLPVPVLARQQDSVRLRVDAGVDPGGVVGVRPGGGGSRAASARTWICRSWARRSCCSRRRTSSSSRCCSARPGWSIALVTGAILVAVFLARGDRPAGQAATAPPFSTWR